MLWVIGAARKFEISGTKRDIILRINGFFDPTKLTSQRDKRIVSSGVLVNVFALTISSVVAIKLDSEPMIVLLRADLVETNGHLQDRLDAH